MSDSSVIERPWEKLRTLTLATDRPGLETFLDEISASEAVRALLRLSQEERTQLLTTLDPSDAAELIEDVPVEHAADLVENLPAANAASILQELDSDERADVLGDIEAGEAEAILAAMPPTAAAAARRLAEYDPTTAGGLMMTEALVFRDTARVGDVLSQFTTVALDFDRYRGQHPYIVRSSGELVGVVSLRSLLLSPPLTPLTSIMTQPLSVTADWPLERLEEFFETHGFLGVPVVDDQQHLIGVVSRSAVSDAALDRADADQRKLQGVVGDELRSMPLAVRARRRLSWLSVNIVLNMIAASVIALYQDTLSAVIALAVFLPIVSDMSGCSGNQAVTISLRELALGVIKPIDVGMVWLKEASVGAINGLALGVLLGLAAWAWKGSPMLGLVVGGALALNTVIAVSIGGMVPLILKRFGVDPAIASGPILTTITDMAGFFLVLSFAAATLSQLTGA